MLALWHWSHTCRSSEVNRMDTVYFDGLSEQQSAECCLCCHLPTCWCVSSLRSALSEHLLLGSGPWRPSQGTATSPLSPPPSASLCTALPAHGRWKQPWVSVRDLSREGRGWEWGAKEKQISEELGLFCQPSPACAISAAGEHKSTAREVQICFCTVRSSLGADGWKLSGRSEIRVKRSMVMGSQAAASAARLVPRQGSSFGPALPPLHLPPNPTTEPLCLEANFEV